MVREIVVVGTGVMAVLLVILDAARIVETPVWFLVLAMPLAGAVIWRGGGASVFATAGWVTPLAIILYLGFVVLTPPLDAVLIGTGYLWFVGMVLSRRVMAAWTRVIRLR